MYISVLNHRFGDITETLASVQWQAGPLVDAYTPLGKVKLGSLGGDLRFVVSHDRLEGDDVLGGMSVHAPGHSWALRVDEVAFPVGAIAHCHTHSGSGWRYLVSGRLRIETATAANIMTEGDSWFEPAGTPVRAVALQDSGVTRFVRCMVIPLADVGRTTFKLVNPRDVDLPRLQITHRHLDHIVQDDAG